MEIRVYSYVEKLSGERTLVNTAYLVFVAIDDEGNPVKVPEFVPVTALQKAEWSSAVIRRNNRLKSL
jgi:acyl-CoA hydrolase